MATSSSSAMKWSLVVVLLLSAVVASQAHQVSCKNTCKEAMVFDGIWTDVGETTVLEVENVIVVEVHDGEGVKHVVKFKCPEDVKALEFVHEGGGFVKAQITDVIGLGSTLHSGRRTLRESERLGGSSKPVSKQRRLLQVSNQVQNGDKVVNIVREFTEEGITTTANVQGEKELVVNSRFYARV